MDAFSNRYFVCLLAVLAATPDAASAQTSPPNAATPKPGGSAQAGQVKAVIIALPVSMNGAATPQAQRGADAAQPSTTPPPNSAPIRHNR